MIGSVMALGGGKQSDSESSGKTANEVLIEHADRLWLSGCDNAARIAGKIQILGGGIIALLGLGFFAFQWLYETPSTAYCPPWVTLLLHFILATVLIFFAFALGKLYAGESNVPFAADQMEFNDDDAGKPTRGLVFKKVHDAYLEIKQQNELARQRLRDAQSHFTKGVIALLLAIVIYLFGSIPTKMYPDAGGTNDAKLIDAEAGTRTKDLP
jgi:hypothetical protein